MEFANTILPLTGPDMHMPVDLQTMAPPPPATAVRADDVVAAHRRGVWRFLRLLGCDAAEADDLAQEVLVVALRRLGDGGEATAAFLRGVARHLFLRSRAKERRRHELLADAAERLWARYCADGSGDAALASLRECVAGLGRRERELVRLFYGEETSRPTAAAALGLRETGVKTALQRLRARLRACLRRRLA